MLAIAQVPMHTHTLQFTLCRWREARDERPSKRYEHWTLNMPHTHCTVNAIAFICKSAQKYSNFKLFSIGNIWEPEQERHTIFNSICLFMCMCMSVVEWLKSEDDTFSTYLALKFMFRIQKCCIPHACLVNTVYCLCVCAQFPLSKSTNIAKTNASARWIMHFFFKVRAELCVVVCIGQRTIYEINILPIDSLCCNFTIWSHFIFSLDFASYFRFVWRAKHVNERGASASVCGNCLFFGAVDEVGVSSDFNIVSPMMKLEMGYLVVLLCRRCRWLPKSPFIIYLFIYILRNAPFRCDSCANSSIHIHLRFAKCVNKTVQPKRRRSIEWERKSVCESE